MAKIIKITKEKYDEMNERLNYLETTARVKVAQAIKTAKEFGDLSENAEYSAAKDEQVQIESEIAKIEDILKHIEIIDESTISTNVVSLGTKVTVFDKEFDEEITYKIVSSMEANSRQNKLSDQSPIGKALLGHKKGEIVDANTPGGILKFEILDITK